MILLVPVATAGVWVREPRSAWVEVGVAASVATAAFTPEGERLPLEDPAFVPASYEQVFEGATSTSADLRAYGEVGLVREIEAFGSLPLRWIRTRWTFAAGDDVLDQHNLGTGDLEVGARWGRALGPVAVSAGPSLVLPLYDNAPVRLGIEAGNQDPYDDRPPRGAGTIELAATAGAGASFGPGWAQVEGGLRLRDRQYSTAVPARAQVGVHLGKVAAAFATTSVLGTLADGEQAAEYQDEYGKGPTVLDRQQEARVGGGLLATPFAAGDLAPFGVLLRADAAVWGRRTTASTQAGLAVTWER